MGMIHQHNSVAKGIVLYCLEEISKRPQHGGRQRLQELRDAFAKLDDDCSDLTGFFNNQLFIPILGAAKKTDRLNAYLKSHWFDPTSPVIEFTEFQPIAPVFVEGIIKALDLSLASHTPKPIDSWWIVDHPKVEIINLTSEHFVTLLLLTPRPKLIVPQGIWNAKAEAWTTEQAGAEIVTRRIENRSPGAPREYVSSEFERAMWTSQI